MNTFFQKYEFNLCDFCSYSSPIECCYTYFDKETKTYQCGRCSINHQLPNGFDYTEFARDLRKMSEKRAKQVIIRYMIWRGATDEETYDTERVRYYCASRADPQNQHKLFLHYPYVPPKLEYEVETEYVSDYDSESEY